MREYKPGDLIRKRATYAWVPIQSDSPSERNKNPLNNRHLGKLDTYHLAIVIRQHPVIKEHGYEINDLEIVSSEGVHGFVQVHHITKISR